MIPPETMRHLIKEDCSPKIVCSECGLEYSNCSMFNAKKAGWIGFSEPLNVIQQDGSERIERIGCCLKCSKTAP